MDSVRVWGTVTKMLPIQELGGVQKHRNPHKGISKNVKKNRKAQDDVLRWRAGSLK
jgi:hypothetical protein